MLRAAFTCFLCLYLLLLGNAPCGAEENVAARGGEGAVTLVLDGGRGEAVCWTETSLNRVYPTSPAGASSLLEISAARNSQVSFQVCVKNKSMANLVFDCETSGAEEAQTRVRRVGYVPMAHHTTRVPHEYLDGVGYIPGLVPDPLFPETHGNVGPLENLVFWITVKIPAETSPGRKVLKVRLKERGTKAPVELTARIRVHELTLESRRDFPVTHWMFPDPIWDAYEVEPWSEEWWRLAKLYIQNMVDHGSNVVFVPLLHGRNDRTPTLQQMLRVKVRPVAQYDFDFSDVRRYINMARDCGVEYFEWSHFYPGLNRIYAPPVVGHNGVDLVDLWAVGGPPDSGPYREFLSQLMPEFHAFLLEENLLDKSFFHISDEPHSEEAYEKYLSVRQMFRKFAPWMEVMDALKDVRFGKEGVVEMPVTVLHHAQDFIDAEVPHWVYYCTVPRGAYLNRFLDTPLPTVGMSGWIFYRLGAEGFLHWGYDYWRVMGQTHLMTDPFKESDGRAWPGIPNGDPFVVYPCKDGPVDSIRWEVFAESLQDYALLQTAGISPDDPMLGEITRYDTFPRREDWILEAREAILNNSAEKVVGK